MAVKYRLALLLFRSSGDCQSTQIIKYAQLKAVPIYWYYTPSSPNGTMLGGLLLRLATKQTDSSLFPVSCFQLHTTLHPVIALL